MPDRESIIQRAFGAQDLLNRRLTDDWSVKDWPYYRAVWTECAEAIANVNWFWWKTGAYGQPLSQHAKEQLQIELVDILHFGLSMQLVEMLQMQRTSNIPINTSLTNLCRSYIRNFDDTADGENRVAEHLEGIAQCALAARKFDIRSFARACLSVDMSLEKTFALYTAKMVLNKFRWEHGYNLPKTDPQCYMKHWPLRTIEGGVTTTKIVEDNVHLAQVALALIAADSDLRNNLNNGMFEIELYRALEERYPGNKWTGTTPNTTTTD